MKQLSLFVFIIAAAFAAEADLEKFATSARQFSAAVYDELLVDNKDNILVSPFSVESALALTQSGAVGTTAEEIRASLFLPETEEETEEAFKSILPKFKSNAYVLHTANKVYVENGLEIKDSFKKVATDVYNAAFENVEFTSAGAVDAINEWVEEETENKIHDLVPPGSLDENTKLVLVNALYFAGNWSIPFDSTLTKRIVFFTSNQDHVETDTMYQKTQLYNYYESPELDAKFLELPFQGEDASMTIILPNKKEGIAILEKQMNSVLITPAYERQYVEVSIPKFKIESTIDFGGVLEKLGIRSAFTEAADFSGIAGAPGDISITKVTQKTFIDVNEVGVEAAAATSIIVGPTSVEPSADRQFIVDHPFAFYIKVNGVVLFEGRVLDPTY